MDDGKGSLPETERCLESSKRGKAGKRSGVGFSGRWVVPVLAAAAVLWAGCGKKGVSTSDLESAFKAGAAQEKAAGDAAGQKADGVVQAAMQDAVSNLKNNNYEDAVVSLQVLRAHPSLNANQLTAVQDTMAAVQTELAKRADAGDLRAQKALGTLRSVQRGHGAR